MLKVTLLAPKIGNELEPLVTYPGEKLKQYWNIKYNSIDSDTKVVINWGMELKNEQCSQLKKEGKKIVNIVLDIQWFRWFYDINFFYLLREYKKLLQMSDLIVAISKDTSKDVKLFCGIDSVTVYPPVILTDFMDLINSINVEKRNCVLYIGRFIFTKRPHIIPQILGEIPKNERPEILIVSDSFQKEYFDYFNYLCDYFKVKYRILSIPREDFKSKIKILKISKIIFYLTSFKGGFGIPTAEGILCGIPPIATKEEVSQEIYGNIIELVEGTDSSKYIQMTKDILNSKIVIKQEQKDFIINNYSVDECVQRLREEIEKIL